MTLTPEQESALNRAIAEHEGIATGRMSAPNYTSSLDAIVDVVQRWLDNQTEINFFQGMIILLRITPDNWPFCEQPALALCLAFAKAAGLEWEKE